MLAGELDRRFELQFTDDYITNWGGEDEKWIQGGDGTWFYLLPNGEFYDWEYGTGQPFGSPLNGTLIATLDSRYYEDPTLFHESQHYYLDRAYGLHKHLDTYYEDWSGEGEKWLVGEDKTWYYILPNGEFYEWDEGTGEAYGNPLSGTRLATLDPIFHARPTLLHGLAQPSYLDRLLGLERYNQDFLVNAGGLNEKWLVGSDDLYYYVTSDGKLYRAEAEGTASGALIAELDPIHHQTPFFLYNGFGNFLQKKYGLYSDGNIFENYGGEGEKWMQGDGEQWYIIHTDGRFVEWDGTPHQASGTTLALVAPSYHTEPSYLFEARAHSLDLHLELFRKFENYTVNACGANEKWIRDTGQRWYYILPNGEFYRWDGETCSDGNVNGTLWETFRPRHYDYPVLLHDTLAFHMDRRLGLYTDGTYGENRGGQGEKWILGEGGTEYFILPEGTLYQSLDGSVTNRTLVNFLIPDYHTKPALLHDAYEDNNTTTTSTTSTSTSTASTSSTGSATMTESSLADDPESDPGMRLEPEFDQIDTVFAEHGDLFI